MSIVYDCLMSNLPVRFTGTLYGTLYLKKLQQYFFVFFLAIKSAGKFFWTLQSTGKFDGQ